MRKHNWKSATRFGWALAIALLSTVLITQPAQAQTFNVIHNFTGGGDGANPRAGLVTDRAGNVYGSTFKGGAGYGTVYRLRNTRGNWVLSPLYTFAGGSDGAGPLAQVTIGADGSLYGSNAAGGQGGCSVYGYTGCGAVFNLKPPPTAPPSVIAPWTKTQLYGFAGPDGGGPEGDLTFDQSGNLYGTTFYGGSSGYGVVYKLTHSGGSWMETVLYYVLNNGDCAYPHGGITFDSSGNIYGACGLNGPYGVGAIYQLTPSGSGWTESTVYGFPHSADGNVPQGGLIADSAGNLYGTTSNAGSGGGGTVFQLSPSMGGWIYNVLYSFTGCLECGPAYGRLVMDAASNLYGTTYADGAYGYGSVFKLTPSGGTWTYTSLHDFTGGNDGAYPYGGVVFNATGNIYGTASAGGTGSACTGGCGVVFEITP